MVTTHSGAQAELPRQLALASCFYFAVNLLLLLLPLTLAYGYFGTSKHLSGVIEQEFFCSAAAPCALPSNIHHPPCSSRLLTANNNIGSNSGIIHFII